MTRLLRATAGSGVLAVILLGVSSHAQQQSQPASQQPPAQNQQQPPPPPSGDQPQPPIFRGNVNAVRVDVIVTDRSGNPVGDLKPEDFEITEQGQQQTIETFKLIELDGGRSNGRNDPPREIRTDYDEETEASRDDVRLFAIFLDDYHVRRESAMMMRDQIARFVDTQLGPSDMIGLMYPLESTAAVRMTRNHAAVVKALAQFKGRKYDYTPMNAIEEKYVYYPTQTVENIRNDVSLSAIKALIVHMGGLKEGRKALLLVSEGYTSLLPPELQSNNAALPPPPGAGAASANPAVGLAQDRALQSANFSLDMDIRDLTDLANKNNVAIYPIDPRGLATNEFGIDQNVGPRTDRTYLNASLETLKTMAFDTDGRAIVNRNDLTAGMKQITQDSSAYYLLGYNSTFTKLDGKFHDIKVRLKRPGLQLRARKGYWAFTADDAAKAMAPPAPEMPKAYTNALNAISAPSRTRVVRTWVGTERGDSGKTKVTFLWEPIPRPAGDPGRGGAPARVSLMAVSADGSPYFRGKVAATSTGAPGSLAAANGGSVSFEVPPGKMALRISVETSDNDVLDSETRDVDVPDLTAPQVSLATPQLFRARTARDYQMLKADEHATPTALREFSRNDRIFIRVAAYTPGLTAPTLTAKMLNRAGQAISTLQVGPSAAGDSARDVEVPLTSVPPGEYLIEITAPDQDKNAQTVVGIRITG